MSKKFTVFIVAAAIVVAGGATVLPHQTAAAEEETQLTTENASLFLPTSYEQYLPLESPSHAAVSANYLAIADGSVLYVYDRAAGSYVKYEHKTGEDETPTSISELQFTDGGALYFTDQSTSLYCYDFEKNAAEPQNISCSTFLIAGNFLYYATSVTTGKVTFYYVSLSAISSSTTSRNRVAEFTGTEPHVAYSDGVLHCIINDNTRESYSIAANGRPTPTDDPGVVLNKEVSQIAGLRYVCAYGSELYYTVQGGNADGLYQTDLSGNARLIWESEGLSTMSVYDGLYCVRGASVVKLDLTEDGAKVSGYEISAASSSENRLSGACDTVRAKDLLVTADAGNRRISVYHFKTQTYTVIPCEFTPTLVATDGKVIAATDGESIYGLNYGETEFHTEKNVGSGMSTVTGLTCLFGKIYYVTGNGLYGSTDDDAVSYGYGMPTGLTSDLYGTLYVSYQNGAVYAFAEEEFCTAGGKKLDFMLPEGHTSLRADFGGNLYCLSQGAIYKNGEVLARLGDFVYGGQETAVSLALGFEDDSLYVCFGNYLVRSGENALPIPTLNRIALGNVKEQAYAPHGADGLLVDVRENAVGILVELPALPEAEEWFPYSGYTRTEKTRGVLLATVGDYSLVLTCKDGAYSARLFRTESCTAVAAEEYYSEGGGTNYLTNGVGVGYFPGLEPTLVQKRLERGAQVTVTGIVTAPESEKGVTGRNYALITYTGESGTVTGYLPDSYLTDVAPVAPAGETYTLAYLKASDGVTFETESGKTVSLKDRTLVRLYGNEDGTYTATVELEGETYSAAVESGMIDYGESDALRISLIVILSVLAVLIVGVYAFLFPRRGR